MLAENYKGDICRTLRHNIMLGVNRPDASGLLGIGVNANKRIQENLFSLIDELLGSEP